MFSFKTKSKKDVGREDLCSQVERCPDFNNIYSTVKTKSNVAPGQKMSPSFAFKAEQILCDLASVQEMYSFNLTRIFTSPSPHTQHHFTSPPQKDIGKKNEQKHMQVYPFATLFSFLFLFLAGVNFTLCYLSIVYKKCFLETHDQGILLGQSNMPLFFFSVHSMKYRRRTYWLQPTPPVYIFTP